MAEELETTGINLSELSPYPGSTRPRKRVGFGEGSGNGKTCGKGQKGQKSRSGAKLLKGFEGGQMPIHRRLPKRGFTSRKKTLGKNIYKVVSLERLVELAGDSGELKLSSLFESGFLARKEKLKILGSSAAEGSAKFESKLVVEAHAVSASARHAIESAGGQVNIPTPPKKTKSDTATAKK